MIYIGLENQTVEKANQIIYVMCIYLKTDCFAYDVSMIFKPF